MKEFFWFDFRKQVQLHEKLILIGKIMILVISLLPFEITFVPAWRLRIVDENRNPFKVADDASGFGSHTAGHKLAQARF